MVWIIRRCEGEHGHTWRLLTKVLQSVVEQNSAVVLEFCSGDLPEPSRGLVLFTCLPFRLYYHLELGRPQSLPISAASACGEALPMWMRSNRSLSDVMMKWEEYQRQLMMGLLCINVDMQASLFPQEGFQMKLPSLDCAKECLPLF